VSLENPSLIAFSFEKPLKEDLSKSYKKENVRSSPKNEGKLKRL